MSPTDHLIQLTMSVFLIFGVYQFYFWCQRQSFRSVIRLHSPLDEGIPFWPAWAWIYSFLYYPAIVYLNWVVSSPRHFLYLAMSFFVLLFLQMAFFLFVPVATPEHWRANTAGPGLSRRFLRFVQKFDQPSNCFPSMHVSVATLTALHAQPHLGGVAYGFPILIAASCVFTKQHYVLDLPCGAVLGWVAFQAFIWMGGGLGA